MAEALKEDGHRSVSVESHRNVQAVRAVFWIVGLILAGEQAWRHQYDVFSDGLSYLDVGDAYWRGDWTNAINSYWSPLYSWLTGLTVRLFSPSPAREGLFLHALGFGIFVLSLFAFDRFLTVLAEVQQRRQETEPADAPEAVPRLVFVALSYCVFLWSFLTLVGTRLNPDMLVAAFFLFASAIVLRACTVGLTGRRAVALGLVLGLGYLAKTPMFLLAFVFLGVVLWRWRKDALARKRVLIAAGVYFAVAAPFAALLSHSKGRPTFGESGRLAYAWYATKLPHPPIEWGQTPGAGVPVHPRLQLIDAPPVCAFQGPLQGTYAGWLDPSYWYEGFRVKFDLKQEIRAIRLNTVESIHLLLGIGRSDGAVMNPALISGLALMFFASGRDWAIVRDVGEFWPALVPTLAALAMYLVVHVEARFLAAQITVLFATLLAAVRVRRGAGWRRLAVGVALLAIGYWCLPFVYRLTKEGGLIRPASAASRFDPTDSSGARWQLQVAEDLQGLGVRPGDKIGFIGRSWRFYWARLAGVRIVADLREGTGAEPKWFAPEARVFSPNVALFWASDLPARRNVMSAFRRAGALAVVCDSIPEGASREGWTNLGKTPFYATLLSDSVWLER